MFLKYLGGILEYLDFRKGHSSQTRDQNTQPSDKSRDGDEKKGRSGGAALEGQTIN